MHFQREMMMEKLGESYKAIANHLHKIIQRSKNHFRRKKTKHRFEEKNILYLIQTKAGLPKIYNCLQNKNYVLLSFYYNTPETDIYYPDSTWTSGRNKLREYALALPITYQYYVFLDDDITFDNLSSKEGFELFEEQLLAGSYLIFTPDHWGYNREVTKIPDIPDEINKKGLHNPHFKTQTVDWFDAAFNTFHRDLFTKGLIFPYVEKFDSSSWWISQFIMILQCNYYFKNKIVQSNTLTVSNTQHDRTTSYISGFKDFDEGYLWVTNKVKNNNIQMSSAIEIYEKTQSISGKKNY